MNAFSLRSKARQFYPTSKHMQSQWIRKTHALIKTGAHLALTGKYPSKDAK